MIHAILSSMNSTMTNWVFMNYKWLEEEYEAIFSNMNWELNLFEKCEQYSISINQSFINMIDILYYDINIWKYFYKRMKIKNQRAEKLIEEMNKLILKKMNIWKSFKSQVKVYKNKKK